MSEWPTTPNSRTPQYVILVVLIRFGANFDQARETIVLNEIVNQVFVILSKLNNHNIIIDVLAVPNDHRIDKLAWNICFSENSARLNSLPLEFKSFSVQKETSKQTS